MTSLLDNQINAIAKLGKYKVGALFMEPGTGKTRTACELIKSVDYDYLLWLTPFQTKDNLQNELALCGILNADIVGIETLSSSSRTYLQLYQNIEKSKCPFLVVDESLKIKNWTAKRTKRIVELGKLAEYKIILNGTPVSRNLLDLWSQMEFLSPKILNMGIAEYKNTFCEWIRIRKRYSNKQFTREYIVKYHNVDYLYSLIKHYIYECNLKLNIGTQYHTLNYQIDDDIKKEYYKIKEEYLDDEKLLMMNNNIFIELTQKMQHLYCNSSEKLMLVKELLKINNPEKTIIFTKFISSQDWLQKLNSKATILSYSKHSYGLNLQKYNVCIFYDKTWDYAQRLQSERRIYRTGQQEQCIYYDLTGDVGLERMIDANINKKLHLLEYFKSKAAREVVQEL